MEQDTLSIFQKIAPDVMGTIKERYLLLRHIADAEPVGRRTLAGPHDAYNGFGLAGATGYGDDVRMKFDFSQ